MCVLIALFFRMPFASAQLVDGATAPDFTFIDLNGNTQNLYSYLNAGKYVAIEVSATWCTPCWNYHSSKSLDSLYSLHDIPGDQTWKVLFIEGDGATTNDQLNGIGTTQGDWVTGTQFPIMNPTGIPLNDFKANYDINSFPRLMVICPNKKIYVDTINEYPRGLVSTWSYVAATQCGPVGLDDIADTNPIAIYPNPASDHTMLYFSLNHSTGVAISIMNILGQVVEVKKHGTLNAGNHSIKFDLAKYTPGMYFFTIVTGDNRYVRKKVIVK